MELVAALLMSSLGPEKEQGDAISAGFVLWYAVPPLQAVTEYAGTAGSIACLYGVVLTLSSALMVGVYSFLGEPQLPRKLVMIGPYQLVRHPQILGNFLFIMGEWRGFWWCERERSSPICAGLAR